MSILNFCAAACALLVVSTSLALAETWRWTDAEGQVHFGDRPPPDVQAEQIKLQRKAAPLGDDARLQRRPAPQNDEAQAAQEARDADDGNAQALNRSRCDRARWALAALDSGRPVYRDASGAYRVKRPPTQPDTYEGPREYLEDAEREAEIAQHRADMDRYCAEFPELQDLSLADEDLRHAEACEFAATELSQLLQDEARATPEEIARRQRFLDEECR
jgi:hypothetical protein